MGLPVCYLLMQLMHGSVELYDEKLPDGDVVTIFKVHWPVFALRPDVVDNTSQNIPSAYSPFTQSHVDLMRLAELNTNREDSQNEVAPMIVKKRTTSPPDPLRQLRLPTEILTSAGPSSESSVALHRVSASPLALQSSKIRSGAAGTYKMAVCDDEGVNRRVLGRILKKLGHVVEYYSDGQELLQAILEEGKSYDVIWLDIIMKVVKGDEACIKLRGDGYKGTIIAATGNCSPQDLDVYERVGFDFVMPKPFGNAEVIHALNATKTKRSAKRK